MPFKRMATALAALVTASCTGTVEMTPLPPDKLETHYEAGTSEAGIIVYRAMPIVEVDAFVQANIPDPSKAGATILTSDCDRVLTRKIVTVADTAHPYRLHYEHGFLEAYSFGATLNGDGILTAINTQSTPDQGKTLQNLTSAASTATSVFKVLERATPHPKCTVTPAFVGYEHLPVAGEIREFGKTTP